MLVVAAAGRQQRFKTLSRLRVAGIVCVARLLYMQNMRSATFPPIRVEPEVRAEVEAVLREGGGHGVDEVMADLQARLDDARRRAAQRAGR